MIIGILLKRKNVLNRFKDFSPFILIETNASLPANELS